MSTALQLVDEVAAEVEGWRRDVTRLFGEIRRWLSEAEIRDSGSPLGSAPAIQIEPMVLNEQQSGPYPIERLVITHGDRQMIVRPVARWVLGADGMVKLMCAEGPFILVNLKQGGGWHYAPDSPWNPPLILTGDLFRQLATTCLL